MRHGEGPVERLTEEECWKLLGTQTLGRIATSAGGVLDIYPMNLRRRVQLIRRN